MMAYMETNTTQHTDIDVDAAIDMFQSAAANGLTRRYHGAITNGDPAEAGTLFIDEFGVITVALAADDTEFGGIEFANVKIGIAYPGFFAWLNDWVTS